MKWSDLVVKRPIAIFMVVLIVILLGAVSLSRLKVDLLPSLNLPMAAVLSNYSGAGPEEVEQMVTRPLESGLGMVQNVKKITSVSQSGSSMILLEFEWGTDMDFATLDMREKIDLVKRYLPDGVEQPTVMKLDPNLMPVVQLAMHGDLDEQRLRDIAENVVQPELERLEGVASVSITGGQAREIQVIVSPEKLQLYNIGLTQVIQALQGNNLTVAGGQVEDAGKNVQVRVTGEFRGLEEIRRLAFVNAQGAVVRVGDVARVVDGQKDRLQYSLFNGRPAVGLDIQKETTGNTVEVSDAVTAALARLQDKLPAGVKIEPIFDQAEYIRLSINNVYREMFLGGILAMVIIFIFLRSTRSTLVIGTSIPISVIATFVLIYFGKLGLNLMTLGGLSLGIGRMVDDAIVVMDNIHRHRQEGRPAPEAASLGVAEVTNAVVASTLTTVAVFLPMAFVEGLASQFFGPMALTVSFALLASLGAALTVIPTLAARTLRVLPPPPPPNPRGLYGRLMAGHWLTRLDGFYRRVLTYSLGHRKLVVGVVAVLFIASLALLPVVGMEFIPAADQGQVTVSVELPKGTVLSETERVADRVLKAVESQPEVKSIYLAVGSAGGTAAFLGGAGTTESASFSVTLKPLGERSRSSTQVADAIRKEIGAVAGAQITVSAASLMGFEGLAAPVQVEIGGDDLGTLESLAGQVKGAVEKVPGAVTVKSSFEEGRPQVQVRIDREKAAAYGLSVAQVGGTVRAAVQGQLATRYREGGSEYDTTVRLEADRRRSLDDLGSLTIASPLGVQVPLREVAELQLSQSPNAINRSDQTRMATVTADLSGERALGAVMEDIQREVAGVQLPPGYTVDYTGQDEMMQESFGQLGLALVLAVILVFMVMAAQFESLLHPFVIMFSIPVSLIGVVAALLLTGRTISIVTLIGIIMLIGIVLSNAIVLVDYINTLRRRGMERNEAILRAGPTRLRPILMTALTTILAMFPLTLGIGEGAEIESPMATAVVGGLIASTVITLVLVPVVYSLLEDLGGRLSRRRRQGRETAAATAAAGRPEGHVL